MLYLGKSGECVTHATVDVFYYYEGNGNKGEVWKYGFELPSGPLGFECMMCKSLKEAFDTLIMSGYPEEYIEKIGNFVSVDEAKKFLLEASMIDIEK